MKKSMKKLSIILSVIAGIGVLPTNSLAESSASVNGKYQNLIQKLHCPSDKAKYGKFNDYGYWAGGPWCGQRGKAGYWVWNNPNWYIWANKGIPAAASANGKYSNLLQTLHCPKDSNSYGKYRDYGYWGGGPWCGQQGVAGYWVWVQPNWYVWGAKNQKTSGSYNLPRLYPEKSY